MSTADRYGLKATSTGADADAAFAALARVELVITDCDGTLLYTDKTLGTAAQAAVKRLGEAGVKFTVASSRPGAGMRKIVETLAVGLPFASYNGGNLVLPGSWQVTSAHKMARDVVEHALARLGEEGVDAWVFIGDAWYMTNPQGQYVPLEKRTVGYDGVLVERFDELDLAAVDKIVASSADPALLGRMEEEFQTGFAGRAIAERSQAYYLDITDTLANKGEAVRELARAVGVDLERVAVLGDMQNDVAMFDVAGVAIAMGQASEKVRSRATFVSSSNDDDGFAVGIDALLAARGAQANA